MTPFLLQAFVYLLAGVVAAPIAKRLGLSSVLGYLVGGVVIGPFALDLVGEIEDVAHVAEFGVVILLFLIGLELRPDQLWKTKGAIFGLGGGQLVATTLGLAIAGLAFGLPIKPALAAGVALAMSSTALVLQTLEERGQRTTGFGRQVFGVLLLQDLAVIPIFALLPLLAMTPGVKLTSSSAMADAPALLQVLAALAAIATVIVGGRYLTRPLFRFIAASRLREIFTATALLLVVAVAALMTLVGLSPALGAFLAGVVLAESEFRRELESDIEPFRGLLLGLFFMTVGAALDIGLIAERPLEVLGLTAGLIALKALIMTAVARASKMPAPEALQAGVFLAQGGEFAFVLLALMAGARVLPPELTRELVVVVALSMAASPLLMAVHKQLTEHRPAGGGPTETPQFDEREPEVIVAGFGRFGQVPGRLLLANGYATVTLDSSIEQIELLRRFGRKVYYGDAGRLDLLRAAGAERAKLLLVAIDDKDRAVELVAAAREAFPKLSILARAWDRRHAYELLRAGADEVERETFEGGLAFGEKALRRLGFSAAKAKKAADIFRRHDVQAFEELAPLWGQQDRYILAVRDTNQTMERLLNADLKQLRAEGPAAVAEPAQAE